MTLSLLVLLLGITGRSSFSQNFMEKKEVKVVFVAYDWLYALGTPTSPSQYFVVEIARERNEKPVLLKLMYFPEPSSVRGGVKYLKIKPKLYLKGGSIKVRLPNLEQSEQCGYFENFLEDENKDEYPQMMFRSFKYESFMTFRFEQMGCYVLDSVDND